MIAAEQLALDGMTRAHEHAERENPEWPGMAELEIIKFAMSAKGPFSIEDVRSAAYRKGFPRPPVEGAWGTPTRRLANRGALDFAGYRVSHNASQHSKPVKLWTSIYSGGAEVLRG